MATSPTDLIGTALNFSTADRNKRDQLVGGTQPFLQSFMGSDITKTPFYKGLLRSGLESTSRAYDNAKVNVRRNARAAGFGYEQPVEQGGETALARSEASDLSRVPLAAQQEAITPGLTAASITSGEAGLFNPSSYFSSAANLSGQNASLQAAQNQALWQAISQGIGTFANSVNNPSTPPIFNFGFGG